MARILVVDDEPYMRDMLQDVLEEAGYTVETACDGVAGLACFRANPPDLVITDILMPNVGGLNLIRQIREQSSELPVIAISGGGKDGKLNFLSTAATFPGVKPLGKPFHLPELMQLVGEALG